MPKRKTSIVPSCVYKYRLYAPQGETAPLAAEAFCQARVHYNKLITIEKRRREEYRQARSRLFPELAAHEARQKDYETRIQALRDEVQAEKQRTRSRGVAPEKKAAIADLIAQKKAHLEELRAARQATHTDPRLRAESTLIDQRAGEAIKALRPELYWGTYQLVEEAAAAARKSKSDPDYNTDPPHRLKSRIGVQIQKGASPAQVVGGNNTLMRIDPVHFRINRHDEEIATGKAARTTLQFRIGSQAPRNSPVWATLPMIMHRPIPDDARIKAAYITRQRFTVRIPWQYHLCVVLEAPSFHRTVSTAEQVGTTTINFGWRSTERGIRIAMVHRTGQNPEEVLLPMSYVGLERKRRQLAGILSAHFNEAKARLQGWMAENDTPSGFQESFADLANWRSRHRFAELMDYWQGHRFSGDDEIFAALAAREDPAARRGARPWSRNDIARASWMVRYRHLQTWLDSVQRKLGNWRDNYYRCLAKKFATTTACLCVEVFDMRQVAKRPTPENPEDQGDERARSNRQLAAVSDLRLKILQAAAKYHCSVIAVEAENNTRRCDACGELHPWEPKQKITHTCANPDCAAVWDQDVNNTNRQYSRLASGEAVALVRPAEKRDFLGDSTTITAAQTASLQAARKELAKSLKSEESSMEP